jgi:hypothetical protein
MLNYNVDTRTITMVAKDTGDFVIAIDNYLLAEGDTVYFTVNDSLEKENALISLVAKEFINNKAVFHLTSQNTNLAPGDYYYDVQVNTADGRVDTVLGPAKFKITGGVKF